MTVFVIERRFAEALDLTAEGAEEVNLINAEEGGRWLYSFLSVDRRKTYCLYEAPSVEAIRRAAARAGIPADVVIEVSGKVLRDGSLTPV
ncbi:MAG TPA: nickel-binding protein [Streptosporangiaceae bacterium]|nr:nickel-binding protein [Streptosporangiaceae bacterium]